MQKVIKHLLFSILLGLGSLASYGQYDIEINLNISPPYPTNFDAYFEYLDRGLVQIYNTTNAPLEVYFRVRFAEVNGRIAVEGPAQLFESFTFQPGVTLLTSSEIREVFAAIQESDFSSSGLTDAQWAAIQINKELPEGSYRLCVYAYNAQNQRISDPDGAGCIDFEIVFAERPIIDIPLEGDTLAAIGNMNILWSHFLTSPDAMARTQYELKLIDITEQNIENIQNAFLNPGISPDFEENVVTLRSKFIQDNVELPLVAGHTYAARVTALDPLGSIAYQFGGHSEIVSFVYGRADTTESEPVPGNNPETVIASNGTCTGEYAKDAPTDTVSVVLKNDVPYKFGALKMTIPKTVSFEGSAKDGFTGLGVITTTIGKTEVKVSITFKDLKVNKANEVFAGTAKGQSDKTGEYDETIASYLAGSTPLSTTQALNITSYTRLRVKRGAVEAGIPISLPIGIDQELNGETTVVGINDMTLTPTQATLTALFSMQNPEWKGSIPTLGAKNVCFNETGMGQNVFLYLPMDYTIPLTGGDLVLKKFEAGKEEKHGGTYASFVDGAFKIGQIDGEIAIPQEVLLAEDKESKVDRSKDVKLKLVGTFVTTKNFILSASLTPCQIPGLEGFSFELVNGTYDFSTTLNPTGMKFPKEYPDSTKGEEWKGVYFPKAIIKAPEGWGMAGEGNRTSFAIEHFIKDNVGVSLYGVARGILDIKVGEFAGFAFSVDTMSIQIVQNQFKKATINGQIGLPILPDSNYLNYAGFIDRPEVKMENGETQSKEFRMNLSVTPRAEGYDIDWLYAHVDFDSSRITLLNDSKEQSFEGKLNGYVKLIKRKDDNPELKTPKLKFTGMEFSKKTIKGASKKDNKSMPFTFVGPTFELTQSATTKKAIAAAEKADKDPKKTEPKLDKKFKIGDFAFSLDSLSLNSSSNNELVEGSSLTLFIQPSIELVRPPNSTNNATENGYSLAASTSVEISASMKMENKDLKTAYFGNPTFKVKEITVNGQVKGIVLKGEVAFESTETTSGMAGKLNVTTDLLDVKLEGKFGSGAFDYWYFYGSAGTKPNAEGKGSPLYPRGAVKSPLKLWTFGGGAYYQMRNAGTLEKQNYVADENVSLGLKGRVVISNKDPKVFWGDVTLEAEFGDTTRISLLGKAYFLKKDMEPNTSDKVDGVEAILNAKLNIANDYLDFASTMDVRVFLENGTFRGDMKEKPTFTLATATLNITDKDWNFWVGQPSNKAKGLMQVPGLNTSGLAVEAYLMMGTKEMEDAIVPTFISTMLGASNKGFSSSVMATDSSFSTRGSTTEGVAFGALLDYKFKKTIAILYIDFRAMLGFDLSLLNSNNICANINDDNGDPIVQGADGWYGKGKVYAGFRGDMGLDIDLFFFSGKISLVTLNAAMLIEGGTPNPTFVNGTASIGYSVMGGIVRGRTQFNLSVGTQCDEVRIDPFAGIDFIASMTPGDYSPGSVKKVSVFAKPSISFNNQVGEKTIYIFEEPGTGEITKYRVRVDNFDLSIDKGATVEGEVIRPNADELQFTPGEILKAQTDYYFEIKLVADEMTENGWMPVRNKKTKKLWSVTERRYFRTGDLPNKIDPVNLIACYPVKPEKYPSEGYRYLQDENKKKEGFIQFKRSTDYLFEKKNDPKSMWWSEVVAEFDVLKGSTIASLGETKVLSGKGNFLVFKMPEEKLPNDALLGIGIKRRYFRNPEFNLESEDLGEKIGNTGDTIRRKGKTYTNYPVSENPPESDQLYFFYTVTSKFNTFSQKITGGLKEWEQKRTGSMEVYLQDVVYTSDTFKRLEYDFGKWQKNGEPFSNGEISGYSLGLGYNRTDQNVHFKEKMANLNNFEYYKNLFSTWSTIDGVGMNQKNYGVKWLLPEYHQISHPELTNPVLHDWNSFARYYSPTGPDLSRIQRNDAISGYKLFPMSNGVYGSSVLMNAQAQTKLPLALITRSVCRAYLLDSSIFRWTGDLVAGVAISDWSKDGYPVAVPDGKYTFVSGEVVTVAGGLVTSVIEPVEFNAEKYKCETSENRYKLPETWGELIYPAKKLIVYPALNSFMTVYGYYSHPEIIGNKKIQVASDPVGLDFVVKPGKTY
jgi:hypothetical protein